MGAVLPYRTYCMGEREGGGGWTGIRTGEQLLLVADRLGIFLRRGGEFGWGICWGGWDGEIGQMHKERRRTKGDLEIL